MRRSPSVDTAYMGRAAITCGGILAESIRSTGGKQRLTAMRLHEFLVADGYRVVTVVKDAVAEATAS